MAVKVGQGHFETDGFEQNQGYSQTAYGFLFQVVPAYGVGLQAGIDSLSVQHGETLTGFDPAFALPINVQDETQRLRLGATIDISSNSTLVLSAISQTRDFAVTYIPFDFTDASSVDALTEEAQYIVSWRKIAVVFGAGHLQTSAGPSPDVKSDYDNSYIYGYVTWPTLKLTAGASNDHIRRPLFATDEVSPKLGLMWTPRTGTTIRAAAFQTVKRELIGNQTIEPTQVAGFNQFFDDPTGTVARRYGVGLDQRLSPRLGVGAEASGRELDIPVISLQGVDTFTWRESLASAYVYWATPLPWYGWSTSLSAAYGYEKLTHPEDLPGVDGIRSLETNLAPISTALFVGETLSARLTATYVRQSGQLQAFQGTDIFQVGSNFWNSDLELSYLFPRRRGQLSIGGRNLFNQQLGSFQDSDPATPRLARGQLLYAKLFLQFW